jgi:uncharacterized protein (TIRG00374 family)
MIHLLGLVLLVVIIWLGGPEAWQEVSRGKPGPILLAFLITGVANMVSGLRLKLVAQAASPEVRLPWRRLYYLTMMANTAGLILPRSVSTVGGKSVGLKALGVSVRRSVSTIFVDNGFDLFMLMPLVVPGLLHLRGQITGGIFWLLSALIFLVLTVVMWWGLEAKRLVRLANWLEHSRRPGFITRFPLGRVVRLLPERPVSLLVFALTILMNGLLALRFVYVGIAVGLQHGVLLYLATFPVTQLSLVFGGLGIFDASWYGVLLLAGLQEQEALTFVIAQRAYIFIFILVWTGFSYLLTLSIPKSSLPEQTGKRQEVLEE